MSLSALALLIGARQGHERFSVVGYWQVRLNPKSAREDGFIFYKDGRMECRRDDERGRQLTLGTFSLVDGKLNIRSQKYLWNGEAQTNFSPVSITHPIQWRSKDSFEWVLDSKNKAAFHRVEAAALERSLFVGEWETVGTTSGSEAEKGRLWFKPDGTFRGQSGRDLVTGVFSVSNGGKTVILTVRSHQGKQVPSGSSRLELSYDARRGALRDLTNVVYRRAIRG